MLNDLSEKTVSDESKQNNENLIDINFQKNKDFGIKQKAQLKKLEEELKFLQDEANTQIQMMRPYSAQVIDRISYIFRGHIDEIVRMKKYCKTAELVIECFLVLNFGNT